MSHDRILLLIDHFGSGGAQRQIINLAKALKEYGYYVEFAIYYPQYKHFEPEVRESDIWINELQKKGRFSVSVVYSIYKLIRHKRFNLIISFLSTPNFYAEVVSVFVPVKCIVSERSAFQNNEISFTQRMQCYFHIAADSIIINSTSHKNALVKTFPFLEKKAYTIYNIVGEKFFDVGKNRLASSGNHVLCVGTINENKNCLLLIKALHYLKQIYNIQINVTWAGKVGLSHADKEYHRQCVDLLQHYEIGNEWNWAGEVFDIANLYSTHSILVHSSFFEGLPNAICEGMASGLLILASNVNEHPHLLADIGTHLLFNPNDHIELAEKLFAVINLSNTDKQDLIDSIYERAQSLFNRKIILRKFVEVIQRG